MGDLWDGADVRWVPEATTRGGVRLRPGDRAVVVDQGQAGGGKVVQGAFVAVFPLFHDAGAHIANDKVAHHQA